MAIWQYTIEMIPKEDLDIIGDNIGTEAYNKFNFWQAGGGYTSEYFTPITKLLPMGESWSKNIKLYGNEDSTCIKLIVENNKIAEVIIRLDFRNDYSKLLSEIVEFCSFNSLLLLDEEQNILPLNETGIGYQIKSSPQYIRLQKLSNKTD
ncbi:hypothetical protein ACFJIV_12185 [Mucilaginibacter sp. UC70_90]